MDNSSLNNMATPLREDSWPKGRSAVANATVTIAMRVAGRLGVGLNALFGRRTNGLFGMVTYHRVAPHIKGAAKPLHNVTPKRFRQQISGLLERGFTFLPLREVIRCRNDGDELPSRTVVLTFDDGFQTLYTNAWPILRELNVPATVFVNTAYLDDDGPFPFDVWGVGYHGRVPAETYRPLTTEQCREMAEDGLIELGAHTHTHRDLRGQPDAFREDLQISVDIMRSKFGLDKMTFAFPFGSRREGYSSDELAEVARQTGVLCGLTTQSVPVDLKTDPFSWGRFNGFPWDTSATLAAKLNGWYSWAPALRAAIPRVCQRALRRASR